MGFIKQSKQLSLISNLSNTKWDKCQVCTEAKHPNKPFNKSIERQTDFLEWIHTNLGYYKNTMSRWGKRYYITFVDDIPGILKSTCLDQ